MLERIFVAINLSAAVKQQVFELQQYLNRKQLPVNWTVAENLHLTVIFLGDLSRWEIDKLGGLVDDITRLSGPFELEFNRLGFFPGMKKSSALFLRPRRNQNLNRIHHRLRLVCREHSLAKVCGKPFLPHLTIGKFRASAGIKKFRPVIKRSKVKLRLPVKSIDIMKSNLATKPVTYTCIHRSFLAES